MFRRFCGLILAVIMIMAVMIPNGLAATEADANDMVAFRPVDCGMMAMDLYDFPFLGMQAKLSENMLAKMNDRDVFVFSQEDYASENVIAYALMRFSAPTQAQKEEEVMSVDIFEWEGVLERIGAIGVYQKDSVAQLDELTDCDVHHKIGESEDGAYEYYISTNSQGNPELIAELEKTEITLTEMHDIDFSAGYNAFSADRLENVNGVGNFETVDIFGNTYNQDYFKDYDLTLVNIFATWCSPCVQEIPELENLRAFYAEKGVKLGVMAIVMDAKTAYGIDEGAVERAQVLYERSGAQFPFIIPDDSDLNGRLIGVEAYPETFFVDSDGNIVSDPYVGANSQEGWSKVVDAELAELKGGN